MCVTNTNLSAFHEKWRVNFLSPSAAGYGVAWSGTSVSSVTRSPLLAGHSALSGGFPDLC